MINEKNFKDIITAVLIIGLFILAMIIIKPVIMSIISAMLLAYIFYPIYQRILIKVKNENLSSLLTCLLLLLIILIPISLIFSSLINQAISLYFSLQNLDFVEEFKQAIPAFLVSSELSENLAGSLNSFFSKMITYFIGKFSSFILNLPAILLQLFVVIFVFFFSLRDGKLAIEYIRSLSPVSKEIENKFFLQFKGITNSVLLGQVVIGIFQGLAAGIGYFIFGVPYAIVLTLLTMVVGIIPLIGPWLVWVPADIYLFSIGKPGQGLGLLIYGIIVISWMDAVIRPIIVSKRTEINSAIVIIGMIGGLFVFGFLGFILGPLILGYVLLVLEIYRKKKNSESLFFKKVDEDSKIKNIKEELLILKDSAR